MASSDEWEHHCDHANFQKKVELIEFGELEQPDSTKRMLAEFENMRIHLYFGGKK